MLLVHRSERADRLVEILGDVLAEPVADPMVGEVVAVPTRGVERWLSQRLSHRLGAGEGREDGVCANLAFPFPGALIAAATASACGLDAEDDPWLPERSVWPLLELVDAHVEDPLLQPLVDHLRAVSPAADGGRLRRFATVRHLADLYDHYGVHRPELIRAWLAGDPAGGWQAELWRLLRARIGVPSPAERLRTASDRIARDPALVDLPPRVSLFGLTRLPASYLQVLEAVAAGRDVHLFLLHPSAALWDKVARQAGGLPRPPARADDPTAASPAHPLLRSWGRDAREMQLVLAAHGATAGVHRPVLDDRATLLGGIQADIRADRPPPGPALVGGPDVRPLLQPGDDSLRIHSCHGRFRQVEVLRDAVLHLLTSDPTLEPRDIVVMCPDIEAFAPIVHAVFDEPSPGEEAVPTGTAQDAGGRHPLRVRLADRSLRQTNPLLAVAAHLLELAGGRFTASEVLDLVSREPVRRRFGVDDDDLSQIERWVLDMGVRWGLDAEHRSRWKLPGLDANSWSAGLDRLLLGVAMADEDQRVFGGTLPVDDVTSGSVDLAGRLAEFVARLATAAQRLAEPMPPAAWRRRLADATESIAVAAPGDSWQHEQLHRVLDEMVDESLGAARPLVDPSEVRSLLANRLRGRPTRANFRTGDLTICTMVPMRSVPHRVVCLLGLDDGVFPRHTEPDGDDLLATDARVGDRDPRSEDRQLLLDALLAATEHLVITFAGRDERTNRERPPAVPISELLDVVDRSVRLEDPLLRPREAVVVAHPLQSFDPRNFTAGVLGFAGPWSHDAVGLAGARALTGPRRGARAFLERPLPPPSRDVVLLESLVRFVGHPVRAFLRERLGAYPDAASGDVPDTLPIELDALERWSVGDRLLTAVLGGAALEDAVRAERARGALPPAPLSEAVLAELRPRVQALAQAVAALPSAKADAESVEVNVALPDGRPLIGTVASVLDSTVVHCTYSTLAPKHRLAAWVRFLALTAARPALGTAAVTVGRGRKTSRGDLIRVATLDPLPGSPGERRLVALRHLGAVVDLYDRGMCEPLPLYCATSAAWAEARRRGEDPGPAARGRWEPNGDLGAENQEPEHRLVFGGPASFDEVAAPGPGPGEEGPGWEGSEKSRLGRLARRLWDPLLELERVEDR